VRTIDPAGSLDNRAGQNAGHSQLLESDAGTDDVDDGIHRTDLVEMDLIGWNTVDTTFGVGDALKDGDGLGLDPIGKGAGVDQAADVGKGALALVGMR
jgi:hypothetical protein